jgi:hypothetical protein
MSSLYYFSSSITYSWNSSEDGSNVEETEPSEMLGMHLVQNIEGFPRALLRTGTFNGVVCGVWTQRFELRNTVSVGFIRVSFMQTSCTGHSPNDDTAVQFSTW